MQTVVRGIGKDMSLDVQDLAKKLHPERIPLMEAFYTIQGEGMHQGKPAFFIRLAGCDVGCHWCDVKDSWKVTKSQLISVSDVVDRVVSTSADMVVVTGGEPLIYDLETLTDSLAKRNLKLHLETSGAYPLTGSWDWICFSPKKFKKPLQEVAAQANELKVIVYNSNDFEWALKQESIVSSECICILQPEWSRRHQMMPEIVAFVKTHPRWRVGLQIHKYLQIP